MRPWQMMMDFEITRSNVPLICSCVIACNGCGHFFPPFGPAQDQQIETVNARNVTYSITYQTYQVLYGILSEVMVKMKLCDNDKIISV